MSHGKDPDIPAMNSRMAGLYNDLELAKSSGCSLSLRRDVGVFSSLTAEDLVAIGLTPETAILVKNAARGARATLDILKNEAFVSRVGQEYAQGNEATKYILASIFSEITYLACHPVESGAAVLACVPGSPLAVAVMVGRESPDFKNFQIFLKNVSSVFEPAHLSLKEQKTNFTPLHSLASSGHADMVGYLIERGANARLRNDQGNTPLLCAVGAGCGDVVGVMLKEHRLVDIDAKDRKGRNAFILAAERGHKTIVDTIKTKCGSVMLQRVRKTAFGVDYTSYRYREEVCNAGLDVVNTAALQLLNLSRQAVPEGNENYPGYIKLCNRFIYMIESVKDYGMNKKNERGFSAIDNLSMIDPASLPEVSRALFLERIAPLLSYEEHLKWKQKLSFSSSSQSCGSSSPSDQSAEGFSPHSASAERLDTQTPDELNSSFRYKVPRSDPKEPFVNKVQKGNGARGANK